MSFSDYAYLHNSHQQHSSSKSSGINLLPSGFEFQYSNDADFQNYGLLSSYSCCDTVNRPSDLWIIDGMLNKEHQIGITIQNIGSTSSGQFDLRVYIEHNEYDEFIILDQTIQVSTISGSSSKMVYLNWIPDYSGNHTIHAITQHPQDDDTSNDQKSRHYTIGNLYENANSAGIWSSMSTYWSIDTDTGITPHDFATFNKNSFYVGDTLTTTYGNNWNENMDTSIINFGDRVTNPLRPFQISFLLSGASKVGDNLILKIETSPGVWKNLGNINTIIDSSAANWNLFNFNVNPIDMNSNSKLRFNFVSNAVNTDSGYWIDDFVMVYDQSARAEEYNPKILSISKGETSAEEWSQHELEIYNGGNLEDKLSMDIIDLPSGWDWAVNYKNGGPIDPQSGIEVGKGETREIIIRIKPSSNSTLGIENLNFKLGSKNSVSSYDSKEFQLDVLPTYLPELQFEEENGFCRPGNSCEIFAILTNAGDVSDSFQISSDLLILRNGWSFDLSWNQPLQIDLESGESIPIRMTVDIPPETIPGQYSSLILTATSDTRDDISTLIRINATAGMISNAVFSVNIDDLDADVINPIPNTEIKLPFTLWNNASTFDIFELCIFKSGSRSWGVNSEHDGMIIEDGEDCINPYIFEVPGLTSMDIDIIISIPQNAQKNDSGPLLTPIIKSVRSGDVIQSLPFNGISVRMISDLIIMDLESDNYFSPGSENILTFNISNFGNGADIVLLKLENFIFDWEYWFTNEGNIVELVELSPEYEGLNVKNIQLHIEVPKNVPGDLSVNFIISISSDITDSETDLVNNRISYNGLTAMVFIPEWVISPLEFVSSEADQNILLNATIVNSGNSMDSQLKVKFELENNLISSPISVVLSIPTFGDEYFSSGQWASIPLDKNQLARIEILVMVPPDIQIPSEIKIRWYVQGGSNQLGESLTLTNLSIIDVSIYRNVNAELNLFSGMVSPSSLEYFTINFSSSSSIIEDLKLENNIPSDWYLSCEDPSNDGEFRVVIPASLSGINRNSRIDCSLQIGSTQGLNEIQLNILDSENNTLFSWKIELAVNSEESKSGIKLFFSENGLLKGLMLTFAGVIISLLVIIILQKKSEDYEVIEEDSNYQYNLNYSNSVVPPLQIPNPPQQILNSSTYQTQHEKVKQFSQPTSRPPNNEKINLQDAFGSLLSKNDEDGED